MAANEAFEEEEQLGNGTKSPSSPGKRAWGKNGIPNGIANGDTGIAQDSEFAKQQKRERSPIWYCKVICSYPKSSFAVTLVLHLLMLVITAALAATGYDIIPIVFERIPLDIQDDVDYLRGLAWSNRNDGEGLISRMSQQEGPQEERTNVGDIFTAFFEIEGGNVFTEKNLKLMAEAEDKLWGNSMFQDEYCMLDNKKECRKPRSLMRYFDGTYSSVNPTVFKDYGDGDTRFKDYVKVLNEAYSNDKTKESFEWFLGAESEITSTESKSQITRMSFYMGLPFEGYQNNTDREEEQSDKIVAYLRDHLTKDGDNYYENGVGDMVFVYSSLKWLGQSIQSQVFKDLALAGGSLAFIIIFVIIQTQSFWVALFAILSIITSFCGANIVYRCIFDYRYFGIFHVLAIFIILGIGADDVFVFFDTWKATAHHKYPSLAHRMSDCYRKASLAMLFTSMTTATAFVVSATSPFLGINTFGLFAALLVVVNYLSVVIYFPTVVIMYHLYFEKFRCCCCCPKPQQENNMPTHIPTSVNAAPPISHKTTPSSNAIVVETDSPRPSESGDSEERDRHGRKNPIVRFFRGPYYHFVTHRVAKWIILVFFLAVIAVFVAFAAQVKVNEEQIKFLPDDSNSGRYLAKSGDAFKGTERPRVVHIVWGLKLQNRSSCHRTDPDCSGELVWDDGFNINSEAAQNQIRDFCSYLRNLPDTKIKELNIKRNIITDIPEVDCFIEKMEDFYIAEENIKTVKFPIVSFPPQQVRKYPAGTQLDFPWTEADARTIIENNAQFYDKKVLDGGFNRYFEIASSFWLNNGFQFGSGDQLKNYGKYLGEGENPPFTKTSVISMGSYSMNYTYGTRLRYMAISVNTTINARTLGYPTGLPIAEAWEKLVTEQLSQMADGLKGGFQCTSGNNLWHWLKVQRELVSSAFIGIGIGLALACPILIIATMNVIVGLMATLTITIITASVIGVIPMAGWKIGVLESLNLVLVVGLAVDYVVHLAEGYSRSEHLDRKGRTRDALEEVGISVLSGAVTTLGASMFLLIAEILFFAQFGIFMFGTIGLSIMYALGLFITALGTFGPENDTGSLKKLFSCCAKKCCKKETEVESTGNVNNSNNYPIAANVPAHEPVSISFVTVYRGNRLPRTTALNSR